MNAEALELSGALAAELARPVLDLTLHQLETELAQLVEYRQERLADTVDRPSEEEIAALDAEIQRYQIAGPAKVSGVAAIFRSWRAKRETARAEANRLLQIVKHYECMEARLKEYAAGVLEKLPAPKKGCRKLVGADGSQLLLKGNGGVQPLEITDAAAVPDDLCVYVLKLAGPEWRAVEEAVRRRSLGQLTLVPERQVNAEAVREALAQPCPQCAGTGDIPSPAGSASAIWPCPACGGTGRHAIPGARLLERGVHVECR
jgi:hypothetical protein